MHKRTCTLPGCDKPHRARGLCATHYNQTHAPDRHKKKPTACVVCGMVVEKSSGGGRKYGAVCSNACRRTLQPERAPRTKLPLDHWVRWYGTSSQWPRFGWAACATCGNRFPMRSSNHASCSQRCMYRAWEQRQGVKTTAQWAATPRVCRHCNTAYSSPHATQTYCSEVCRERARKARGVPLFHGWISPAERRAIYQRDNYTCWLCGGQVDMSADQQRDDWAASLDHVLPRSKGGTHDADNLKTAHRWCNAVRSDRVDHELFAA